jgi:hypothetical protein
VNIIKDITKIDYDKVGGSSSSPYFVQWITATNRHNEIVLLGWCVKEAKTWNTMFKHEDKAVCMKVCEMLNEGVTKC